MIILRSVLDVKFTKYCTCAVENPGELEQLSWPWTGFSIILDLEPYMLEAYLEKKSKSSKVQFQNSKVPIFQSFKISDFQIFKVAKLKRFKNVFVFLLIDIDPILSSCDFMFWKISIPHARFSKNVRRNLGIAQPRLFNKLQMSMSKIVRFPKNSIFQKWFGLLLELFGVFWCLQR